MPIEQSSEQWRTQALAALQALRDTAPSFNAQGVIDEATEAVRHVILSDAGGL